MEGQKIRIEIPPKAAQILEVLHGQGYEAYVVGGCVRDSILGREPGDWDITTSAKPEQVKQWFRRTVDTGILHGTVTVLLGDEGFEVTTYRVDGEYADGRHPKQVRFTASLEEDLLRRDFTINAMAYSYETGLVDLYGGLDDLEQKKIRCVGDPYARFGEDALRMMRAVRFSAQLGFEMTDDVRMAIRYLAGNLRLVSAERIQTELVKLLVSPRPGKIRDAYECGITAVVLPEVDRMMAQDQNNPHHAYTVGEHSILAMENIAPDRVLRLTMFFHDMGKPDVCTLDENGIYHFRGHAAASEKIARTVLRRLKFDNDTLRAVCNLVGHHSWYPELAAQDVRKKAHALGGAENFELFLQVKRADILAHHPNVIEKKLVYLARVIEIWNEIKTRGDCLSLKELAISGRDLMEEGFAAGPQLGKILNLLLEEVIENPYINRKKLLLERAKELANE